MQLLWPTSCGGVTPLRRGIHADSCLGFRVWVEGSVSQASVWLHMLDGAFCSRESQCIVFALECNTLSAQARTLALLLYRPMHCLQGLWVCTGGGWGGGVGGCSFVSEPSCALN